MVLAVLMQLKLKYITGSIAMLCGVALHPPFLPFSAALLFMLLEVWRRSSESMTLHENFRMRFLMIVHCNT
jgi:hypothetical protein